MKHQIRKILAFGLWLGIIATVLVLLVAAIKVRKHKTCTGYAIEIKGSEEKWFINKKNIAGLLRIDGVIKGRSLHRFNLNEMEASVKKNPWIKDAELFFDNNQVLRVRIEEREPVARVFTRSGKSFYIDSSRRQLPLSGKYTARVPVVTGFPADNSRLKGVDSALMAQVEQICAFLMNNPFWMAQVAQVDITDERTFEIIPVVGNHIIELGDGTGLKEKFDRLLLFYRKVLSKTGMELYDRIKVQYDGQVVGVKK